MRDLFFVAFLGVFFLMGLKRPFLLVAVYAYIDIVSPQRLSYFLLNSIPISAIAFAAMVGAWLVVDDKKDCRFSARQALLLILLLWCGYTTATADFPVEAMTKWNWVWKAIIAGVFLPLTLRTRLRIEAMTVFMILCASTIIINGGMKTALSGGGYGVLNLMVENNSGLYEGSIISCVAISLIPLILWLSRHGTIFAPDDWRVKAFCYCLCLACMLMPIGTEARTGLVCIVILAGLMLVRSPRRFVYGPLMLLAALISIPFLPASFTQRMQTIENHQGDESASTRVAVWMWTLDYVKTHPGGGGFDNYLQNSFTYFAQSEVGDGDTKRIERRLVTDKGRAYHSAYFEMLGEQGYFGFLLWALIHGICFIRTEMIRRLYRKRTGPDEAWIAPFALALQQGHIVYMVGSLFVGIAYQPFIFMMLALQIGLDTYLSRRRKAAARADLNAAMNRPRGALA
ncbi:MULTISPECIES: putative O-glycosylation ligase, exosortase A system-associated [unclassified Sphingobium]|uniref:putative O-glycosylation ligase, exosortase A system-associated n=1 Tax=unclassified Sphingobium TaxID=2611147 RepID=UPI000D169C99|nr:MULTISPECIES: putative O-glycosylation ligase, exosortase A system-associated [unclassified Sphingobium]MBG6117654.1 putative O-glycosylation ligase (exosortase A-associated) [Sphingobium sp. JAI105]PSO12730.1 putative O-glycosylation ligase, exosortase A system-associated [Sphingobium sp. AEW4]TWD09926.1 putative O-glycosylation ligase (exosortase A-associated) [Sphingobium sp. AEW010]TWD26597.1 putative O-glycosylation ligase (exosortase A-associated) [Sphingobium sp. AEW013]TWD27634.1 pu